MFRLLTLSVFILVCSAAAGCGDDPPTAAPIDPPTEITETFSGTLTVLGASTHLFSSERAGLASVEITSLAPDDTAVVSLIFGTWNGVSCKAELIKDDATTGITLQGNASALGAFCVRIADIGRLTEPLAYTITVKHF